MGRGKQRKEFVSKERKRPGQEVDGKGRKHPGQKQIKSFTEKDMDDEVDVCKLNSLLFLISGIVIGHQSSYAPFISRFMTQKKRIRKISTATLSVKEQQYRTGLRIYSPSCTLILATRFTRSVCLCVLCGCGLFLLCLFSPLLSFLQRAKKEKQKLTWKLSNCVLQTIFYDSFCQHGFNAHVDTM